jgi:hypothetical protein
MRNYSLRVTPGDRRFAMLSGGEQTKLALAMTLVNRLIRPEVPAFPVGGKIYRRKQLGGLLNYYFRDAAT